MISVKARLALASAINCTARFRALSPPASKAYDQLYVRVTPLRSREVLALERKQVRVGLQDLDEQGRRPPRWGACWQRYAKAPGS